MTMDGFTGTVVWAAIAAAALAAGAAPKAGRFEAAALSETAAIRADATAIDQAWYRCYGQLAAGAGADANAAARVVRLTLKAAVFQKDLHLELYRDAGAWVRCRAWAPAWNDMEHVDAASGDGPHVSPRFWRSDDAAAELARWRDFAGRNGAILERAIKLAGDSDEARRAAAVLKPL